MQVGPAKLGTVQLPFTIGEKHIQGRFPPCPGLVGLAFASTPSQLSLDIPGRAEPHSLPSTPENAGALRVYRFHVRWFPRKPLALHVCRLTPYLLSFG